MDSIEIYCLKDFSLDDILTKHLDFYKSCHATVTDGEDMYGNWVPFFTDETQQLPRKSSLYPKYQYLIHLIIEGCIRNKDNKVHLHSLRVLKPLFGDSYRDMLYNLNAMGVISLGSYEVGKHSTPITLNDWNIDKCQCSNKKVIGYHIKYTSICSRINKELSKKIPDNDFFRQYNENLGMLHMVDKEGAQKFAQSLKNEPHTCHYIQWKIKSIERQQAITSVDRCGRIYHYLTNLPREMKSFLNIKFSVDCHNSHPLLLNYLLIKEYQINDTILEEVYNIIDGEGGIYYHNVSESLRNRLKNKGLRESYFDGIPDDVLQYIYETSKGILWDRFTEMYLSKYDRNEVKEKMLACVFYGDEHAAKHSEMGKDFAREFPSVARYILKIKRGVDANLSIAFMRVESKIFREILARCFDNGWNVVSIHDNIVVLDTPANKDVSREDVEEIMREVYNKYQLHPSFGS